jgi:dTDP-4-dehydrorhamnose reductase
MKRVLLIGSSGFLGKALYKALTMSFDVTPTHAKNFVFSNSETYDFFADEVFSLLEKYAPEMVVMAAAVEKDVDFKVFASRVDEFVDACKSCYLVYLSSDALFDGHKGLYTEHDLPNPKTSYSHNLAYFEEQIQTRVKKHLIVRPSYLYGFSQGHLDSRLQKTKLLLEAGETVEYFDDMFKSPLEVNQAAFIIARLIEFDQQGIIHVAGPRKSVYEFHYEAMQALKISVKNLESAQMPIDTALPRDTSLNISKMTHLIEEPLPIAKALKT